jgi:hypothetical protein
MQLLAVVNLGDAKGHSMTTGQLLATAGILLALVSASAQKRTQQTETRKFASPDGTIVASILSRKSLEATNESLVELRAQDGRVLAKRNYDSQDGQHGYGVTKAAWTPDSQFFVFSLESSGGHQAWHTPVQFFSRSEVTIISLDDALGDAVTNPSFFLSAPDSVTVELKSSGQMKTISLSGLQTGSLKNDKLKKSNNSATRKDTP